MKTLVAGWFSFESGHATAGDLITRDLVCEWLDRAGHSYDVAVAPPFYGGVDLRLVDPEDYSQAVFVCGPFEKGELEAQFLSRFGRCRLIGINLSMQVPLEEWNPFDILLERDSSCDANPDIAFLSLQNHVPMVGICRVEDYEGSMVGAANAAIQQLVGSRQISFVEIDTRLDSNSTGLRSPAEIESLIARMDALITTRLHGFVLALKNGVPVIAIDPMAGGAKIRRQAELIDWPVIFNIDQLTGEELQKALDYCLTEEAREKAVECRDRAVKKAKTVRERFISMITDKEELEHAHQSRLARISPEEFQESETLSSGFNSEDSPTRGFGLLLKFPKRIKGFLWTMKRRP